MVTPNHPGPMNLSVDAKDQPVTTKTDARQGEVVHRVRYMLYFGIPIVIIGFIVAYMLVRH